MKRDNKLDREDFYHQFHNFHAVSTEHADDREPYPKNGESGPVGPAVHFKKDHAKAHPKRRHHTQEFGSDAIQKAVYIAKKPQRGRP